ncbi:hypothetical protein KZZ52_42720 [Dactylosporangium sp. AC04546]|uniref:hypothetical protein n=1 Tax=Dactylosporangium sp. AC04546 TaxID=2862460 RepID=UPI002E7C4860|nr:hypothetical protein [Dactylosporangium sp. AC04546]WVK80628.1 hypothetical protein KZZ52_42720 [Dactylosporangium sp. AC04546]
MEPLLHPCGDCVEMGAALGVGRWLCAVVRDIRRMRIRESRTVLAGLLTDVVLPSREPAPEAAGSHAIYVSQPGAVADLIRRTSAGN